MRVAVVAAVVLLASALPVAAQERQFGGKIGPTFSTLSVAPADADQGYGVRTSIAGGGFLVLPVSGPLSVQFEALFNPKGGELDVEENDVTATLIFDYLEFPVLARITPVRTGASRFYLFAGPSAGIRLRASQVVASSGGGYDDDISPDISRFEISLVAGAGLDFGRRWLVDGRYSWGLNNVNNIDDDDTTVRNRAFTVLAGVRF